MSARVPLDVDLEDKLLYGLTPTRLAYMVVAMLGGFALWSSHWAPSPVRAAACSLVIAIGAALAWGRWRGRAADGWVVDITLFVIRSYCLTWNHRPFARLKRRPSKVPDAVEKDAAANAPEPLATAA